MVSIFCKNDLSHFIRELDSFQYHKEIENVEIDNMNFTSTRPEYTITSDNWMDIWNFITRCPNLLSIDIETDTHVRIPADIENNTKLESLYIKAPSVSLPLELGLLPIKVLILMGHSYRYLWSIPKVISQLDHLKTLNIKVEVEGICNNLGYCEDIPALQEMLMDMWLSGYRPSQSVFPEDLV